MKQFFSDSPLPPRIMSLLADFDPNLNANADYLDQARINRVAKEQAGEFWDLRHAINAGKIGKKNE